MIPVTKSIIEIVQICDFMNIMIIHLPLKCDYICNSSDSTRELLVVVWIAVIYKQAS